MFPISTHEAKQSPVKIQICCAGLMVDVEGEVSLTLEPDGVTSACVEVRAIYADRLNQLAASSRTEQRLAEVLRRCRALLESTAIECAVEDGQRDMRQAGLNSYADLRSLAKDVDRALLSYEYKV